MRIDSSGNVLAGKTAVGMANEGIELNTGNYLGITKDSAPCAYLRRNTNDGTIIEFRKDGTTVGSIGVEGSDLTIGTGDTGLQFRDASDAIRPFNTTTNSARDASIDLGRSSERFRDLYLSGGVYLGGTGAANKLDDYEEGTWTPNVNFGGASTGVTYTKNLGHYTKIGRMVYASFDILLSSKGTSTGGVTVGGLPIANYGSHQNNAGTVICESDGVDWPQTNVYGMVWSDGNIYVRSQNTTAYAAVSNTNFSNTTKIFGMMVYEAA
jgi:hypothetical protein